MRHGDVYMADDVLCMFIDNTYSSDSMINDTCFDRVNAENAGVVVLSQDHVEPNQDSIICMHGDGEWITEDLGINIIDLLKEALDENR